MGLIEAMRRNTKVKKMKAWSENHYFLCGCFFHDRIILIKYGSDDKFESKNTICLNFIYYMSYAINY